MNTTKSAGSSSFSHKKIQLFAINIMVGLQAPSEKTAWKNENNAIKIGTIDSIKVVIILTNCCIISKACTINGVLNINTTSIKIFCNILSTFGYIANNNV